MEQYYLAIDIGASSGRHILGHMEDGKMVLEEIYRFPEWNDRRERTEMLECKSTFQSNFRGNEKV